MRFALGAIQPDDPTEHKEEDDAHCDGRQDRPRRDDPEAIHISIVRGLSAVGLHSSCTFVASGFSCGIRFSNAEDEHTLGMNTVLRATGSAEFLALVPALAGFTPRQSIVLLPFQKSRAHGAMRIDLPHPDIELDEYVDTAIGLLSRVGGTDAVAVVVYTDESPQLTPDGIVLPVAVVVDELLGLAADLGLGIVDALCVTPGGWSSYLHDDPTMRPTDDLPDSPTVPGLADVSGDQDAGVALPVVDFAEKERVGRALRDLSDALIHEHLPDTARERVNPQALAASLLLDDVPLLFEDLLDTPENQPPFVTAALLWCLDRPRLRDVALVQWASDLETGLHTLGAQLAYAHEGATVPNELGEVFLGRGPTPDTDRLRVALTVVRNAAARAPRASRPAPLTAAAWLSWALGRSTHAAHYLRLATEIDPTYSLALLMHTMIDAAMLPEWTFQRGEYAR